MNFLTVIQDKKLGKELTKEQIELFANGAADGSVPDYQLAALLMAIRLNGMTKKETAELTMAMAHSGDMLTPDVGGIPVDKHSTGGVGDTTTLILAPLVAVCGGKVLKMSGRGLGHTGGTVDKLESIPFFRTTLAEDEFVQIVRSVGCAVVGQSKDLAPADKRLYALRDVTATVDSIPLIASSILSKKFASGAQAIVLDVKCGSGALLETVEQSITLAQEMVSIGTNVGRNVLAVISSMDEPLGTHVGNALEVKEAIDILSGKVTGRLKDVAIYLGSRMLVMSEVCSSTAEADQKIRNALESGDGLRKLAEMIHEQGGDERVCYDTNLLPKASIVFDVLAQKSGYIAHMDTTALGNAAQRMGAGRITKEDVIDPAVGFVMKTELGAYVHEGDVLATVYLNKQELKESAITDITEAIEINDQMPETKKLIIAEVSRNGVVRY